MYFKLLLVFSIICGIRAQQMQIMCITCDAPCSERCPYTYSGRTGCGAPSTSPPMCYHYRYINANGQYFQKKGCGIDYGYDNKKFCQRIMDDSNSTVIDCQQCGTDNCNYGYN